MPALMKMVEEKIIVIRNQKVLLDRDVAEIYGVETKRVNEAVRNNPLKFREGYVFTLSFEETSFLRTKKTTIEPVEGKGHHSKYNYKAFTSKGLYMLATILKSEMATYATIAIIESFDKDAQARPRTEIQVGDNLSHCSNARTGRKISNDKSSPS
ncbi:MAG: ORF6N domain-containing protein [Bacteroidales bacterium]|nr:ORF6N domain-containing protein [Bacteroidales bacterium]